ncbi:MAG: hypothetical protein P8016_07650 [Sedimentisphaerales bacterium]
MNKLNKNNFAENNLCMSFLRRQESILSIRKWIPAFAGMTLQAGLFEVAKNI